MNLQNLQQVNGTLLMTNIMDNIVEKMKMIQPLNLKQKSLNQIFGIPQIHIFENLDIIMPMYNLIEYSDNYADSSGSLFQFKRDESPINNVALDNSTSFKHKASLLRKADDADGNDRSLEKTNNICLIFLCH